MIEKLRDRKWAYILLSILLAFVFWLYVRADKDPVQTSWFYNVPVEITNSSVLTRQGLTVAGLSEDTVDLRIEAAASVQDSLYRSRKELTVAVDVSKCVEGENTVVYTPSWPASVNAENLTTVDREPATITVTVEKLYTKSFEVEFQLKGKVADGYQAGTPVISPETVVVSGSVEQVSQVSKVVAILEDENLDQRYAGDLPLILLDGEGNELTDLDVTLDAETAYVVLPVVVVKEVDLTVNFIPGGGVSSEENYSFEITPKTITVAGAETDLESLEEISLGSVDLSKVLGSGTYTFSIELDPALENVSGVTTAKVEVTIKGLSTKSFVVDNIQLVNCPDIYTATLSTQERTVVVRGKEEDLESIDASQLSIVVDLSDISAVGLYSVPSSKVKVYLNAGSSVGVIGEYSIVVNVSRR